VKEGLGKITLSKRYLKKEKRKLGIMKKEGNRREKC